MAEKKRQFFRVQAWRHGEVLLERYEGDGFGEPVGQHAHADYQIGAVLGASWKCAQRGSSYLLAPGSLLLHQAGVVHDAMGDQLYEPHYSFCVLYAGEQVLRNVAIETARDKALPAPFFPRASFENEELASAYLRLHQALIEPASALERDSLLWSTLVRILLRCSKAPPSVRRTRPESAAVKRVRDFLHENHGRNVSLDELALVARLSRFHLLRVFRKEVGMPPHAYQTQVRIHRAKAMLLRGASIAATASAAGFTDQPHFTRQFKRAVGVPPGHYLRSTGGSGAQDVPTA